MELVFPERGCFPVRFRHLFLLRQCRLHLLFLALQLLNPLPDLEELHFLLGDFGLSSDEQLLHLVPLLNQLIMLYCDAFQVIFEVFISLCKISDLFALY